VWTTTAGLYVRVNGATVGPLGTGGGGGDVYLANNQTFTGSNVFDETSTTTTTSTFDTISRAPAAPTTDYGSVSIAPALISVDVFSAAGTKDVNMMLTGSSGAFYSSDSATNTVTQIIAYTDGHAKIRAYDTGAETNLFVYPTYASIAGGKFLLATSVAGYASMNLPHGVAPTSPANGDLWTTTSGLYARINGSTVGPFGGVGADGAPGAQGPIGQSVIPYGRAGTIAVATGVTKFRFPFAATILGVSAAVGTAPTGASLIVDVNKNGTTIFTTQGNRPAIADSALYATEVTNMDVTSFAAGDYLTVDVDQIGSTVAGSDLVVFIRYRDSTGGGILNQTMTVALSDEATAITTGTAKVTMRAPSAMILTQIPRASLNTASSSGNPTVDINVGGSSILHATNKLAIDANEKTSTTAATATSLVTTSIADDAEITFDIDVAGTGAKGLKVVLYYTVP
jgi:hypothetical protein